MIFCAGSCSALGPPFMRRSIRAGSWREAERDTRTDEGDEEQPALPIGERTGCHEQQHRQAQREQRLARPGPANEDFLSFVNAASLPGKWTARLSYPILDLSGPLPLEHGRLRCG
jgi:hypothetical protein